MYFVPGLINLQPEQNFLENDPLKLQFSRFKSNLCYYPLSIAKFFLNILSISPTWKFTSLSAVFIEKPNSINGKESKPAMDLIA